MTVPPERAVEPAPGLAGDLRLCAREAARTRWVCKPEERASMSVARSPGDLRSQGPDGATIDRASPADLVMLAVDTGPVPEQLGALLLLDNGSDLDPDAMLRVIADRATTIPRLRQRLVWPPAGCGRPVSGGRCPGRTAGGAVPARKDDPRPADIVVRGGWLARPGRRAVFTDRPHRTRSPAGGGPRRSRRAAQGCPPAERHRQRCAAGSGRRRARRAAAAAR